ncbi:MAG: hypothetical protein WBD40_05035, partial [Tepidisphaeraceae bacterium]
MRTTARYSAAAAAAHDGLSVTFTHAGGAIALRLFDVYYADNTAGPALGAPTFTLGGVLAPVHERYAYDTSDRRVVKEIDVNNDDDFTDPEDTTEAFVYDGDEIALVFDVDDQNVSTLKNRYLHGPGVDDVLAEEAVRDFTLSTTTVTLDG